MFLSNVHIKSDYKSFYLYNYGEGEKSVQGIGGKAWKKETTWKTKV
jgi:hypothetical protein